MDARSIELICRTVGFLGLLALFGWIAWLYFTKYLSK